MSDKKLEKLFKKALGKAKPKSAFGYETPKPAPGHSERLRTARTAMSAARKENIARFGSARAAKKAGFYSKAHPPVKTIKLARVKGDWFQPSKVLTDPHAYEPKKAWFFGVGNGYSITGVMVKSDNESNAVEAAEEKYPHLFFTKLLTHKQYAKLEENPGDGWEENPEHYRYIEGVNKFGLPEEDIRIFAKVEVYVPSAVKVDEFSREAILPDGTKVEYTVA